MLYYRGTRSNEDPMSDWGHAMFTDNKDRAYFDDDGDNTGWIYDGTDGVHITDLYPMIVEAWSEDWENDNFSRCNMKQWCPKSGEEVAEGFNPSDIVDHAGNWDHDDLLPWIWERILEPKGIDAVITEDGAIVFEPSLIRKITA